MPTGLDDVLRGLADVTKTVLVDSMDGLEKVGEDLLEDSQAKCPVRTGFLRDSGYVKRVGNFVEVGFDAPYAADVHENTDASHSNGDAKFLETPFKQLAGTLPDDVAKEVRI